MISSRVVFVGGKPGNFPLTGADLPSHCGLSENLGEWKGEGKGRVGETTCLTSPPPLASASNTTLISRHPRGVSRQWSWWVMACEQAHIWPTDVWRQLDSPRTSGV